MAIIAGKLISVMTLFFDIIKNEIYNNISMETDHTGPLNEKPDSNPHAGIMNTFKKA
jgi:hypothetical protein